MVVYDLMLSGLLPMEKSALGGKWELIVQVRCRNTKVTKLERQIRMKSWRPASRENET